MIRYLGSVFLAFLIAVAPCAALTKRARAVLLNTQPTLNYLSHPNNFTAAGWSVSGATIAASGAIRDPTGASGASLFTATANNQTLKQSVAGYQIGVTSLGSVFLHSNTLTSARLSFGSADAVNACQVIANISAGTITSTVAAGNAQYCKSGIAQSGNGWFEVWVTGYYLNYVTTAPALIIDNATAGAGTFYVWCAQLQRRMTPTSCLPAQ